MIFSILVGWIGGALVSQGQSRRGHFLSGVLQQPAGRWWRSKDVCNGLFKSFVFAVVIGVVSCHQGLQTIGGPRGIGRSVTKAVVNSIVLILILDYFLTRFLLYLD